jgi:hypothetical protein
MVCSYCIAADSNVMVLGVFHHGDVGLFGVPLSQIRLLWVF